MEETNQNNQQMVQNTEKPFVCTGDCLSCHKDPVKRRNQWSYCAVQNAYNTMRMLGDMQAALKKMEGTVEELKSRIEAIQNSESNAFDPIPIAPGAGADS